MLFFDIFQFQLELPISCFQITESFSCSGQLFHGHIFAKHRQRLTICAIRWRHGTVSFHKRHCPTARAFTCNWTSLHVWTRSTMSEIPELSQSLPLVFSRGYEIQSASVFSSASWFLINFSSLEVYQLNYQLLKVLIKDQSEFRILAGVQ